LPNVAPSNVYPTKDGMLLIAANQDTVFGRLTEAMNRPDLVESEKYATHSSRGAHQVELDSIIADWTRTIDTATLEEMMAEYGIPAGKIYRAPEMLEDAHFKAREAIIKTQHPEFGELMMQNVAPKLSATPGSIRLPGPTLGQHNDEVYGDLLNFDNDRLAELAAAGII
jgi:formyl-CoA transferase